MMPKKKHRSFILSDSSVHRKDLYIIFIFALLTSIGSLILFTPINTPVVLSEKITNEPVEIEPLREVYEEEKNLSLDNVPLRYSVFENGDYGYKFAYPVGFTYDWKGPAVYLVPKSGLGSITVTMNGNQPVISASTHELDTSEAQILNSAADFIGQTFELTGTTNTDRNSLFERFGSNPGTGESY